MNVEIIPSILKGNIEAVSSKSDVHRCLICSALADNETKISVNALSEDMIATIECLKSLGSRIKIDEGFIEITPLWNGLNKQPVLDCGESGSTLRFLLPLAGVICENSYITGRGRLPNRPLSPLYEEMIAHGSIFACDRLPLNLSGKLRGGRYELSGKVSSQFISGLLFALPLAEDDSEIIITSELESAGYVDMTLNSLTRFGIIIDRKDNIFKIKGGQKYISPCQIDSEGDWSNAAFWLSAGALNGEITCGNLNIESCQRDKNLLDLLKQFGADIYLNKNRITVKKNKLKAIEINASDIPDIIPILAVVASVAEGRTVIYNAGRLRLKESDRLKTVSLALKSLGADIEETSDGLIITGKESLRGGIVDSFGDHRIAMSMAIAAAVCEDKVIMRNAEAVNKSYPDFFKDYALLGGNIKIGGC